MKKYSKINIINDFEGTVITVEPTDKTNEIAVRRIKKIIEQGLKENGDTDSRVELVEM